MLSQMKQIFCKEIMKFIFYNDDEDRTTLLKGRVRDGMGTN